jgi:hypothetical protein
MLQRGWARLLAVAALVGAASPAGAFLLIDGFSTQQILLLAAGGSDTAFSTTPAIEALGGERDIDIGRLTGNDAVEMLIHPMGGPAQLFMSSPAGTSASWRVVWDGPDGGVGIDADGLGGIDLTQGGLNTGFLVRAQSDLTATVEIAVTGASGGSTAATLVVPPGAGFDYRFLPFSSFASPAVFADAGSVSLTLSGSAGLDAQIDQFLVTVPEPVGTCAAVLTLLATACRRRHTIVRPRG